MAKTPITSMRLEPEVKAMAVKLAKSRGLTLTALIHELLEAECLRCPQVISVPLQY